jgi:hypothetical protein
VERVIKTTLLIGATVFICPLTDFIGGVYRHGKHRNKQYRLIGKFNNHTGKTVKQEQ